MKQKLITKKQKRVYDFIVKFINENEYAPTIREVAKGLNLSSPATVYSHIEALRNKGYLENNKRGTRILKIADKNKPTYKELEDTINKAINIIQSLTTCEDTPPENVICPHYQICNEIKQELLDILERDNEDEN